MEAVALLLDYALRLAPGVAFAAAILVILPREAIGARIATYIGLFVLMRDAMTPAGLWQIDAALRLAFHPDPLVLALLGTASLGLFGALYLLEPGLRPLLVWWRAGRGLAIAAGVVAGSAAALPVLLIRPEGLEKFISPTGFLGGLLVLAIFGNLLEEVLFRGYLQNYLTRRMTPLRAAFLSGLIFATCHAFLAITVTEAGWPLLAFTLWEGIICALLAWRLGLVAAAVAHGTAIFLIAVPIMPLS